uniref:CCHC-type domain-containing protein n=1 Tax=Trichuris muris TaxID=70415 RepID=A0A5S6QTC5_TRIMR
MCNREADEGKTCAFAGRWIDCTMVARDRLNVREDIWPIKKLAALGNATSVPLKECLIQRLFISARDLQISWPFESARNDVCVIRDADRMHVDIEMLPVSSQPRTVRKQFCMTSDISGRCSSCGDSKHQKDECPFRRARCQFCRRIGYIERACLSKEDAQAHMVQEETDVASPGSED